MKRILLISIASLMLTGCADENSQLIENYLNTTSYVKNDAWKVDDINKIDNGYYVDIKMNSQNEASYKLMYSLSRSSREASENLESVHRGFLKEMCPRIKTKAGKAFWDKIKIDYFMLNITVDGKLINFDNTDCGRDTL